MPEQVVFWDIDGTLISSSLERRFFKRLRDSGHVSIGRLAINALSLALRTPPVQWYKLKLAYLRGMKLETVESLAGSCWEENILPELRPAPLNIIRQLRSAGVRQVLLSGTLALLARPLAQMLEISDILCAEPEICGGVFSGRLTAPHPRGKQKVVAAEEWLRAHGINWTQVVVLADNWRDRFLLRKAAKALVVNADTRLTAEAKRRGWGIVTKPADFNHLVRLIAD